MTDQKKLQEITTLVARWKAGDISESAAMIVIADLVAPTAVTAADIEWGQNWLQTTEAAREYDRWRTK